MLDRTLTKERLIANNLFEREYCDQIEKLTLADFKQGRWQSIYFFARDAFLVAEWVQQDRINTVQIDRDAKMCFDWILSQTWYDKNPRNIFLGYEKKILENWESYFQSVVDKVLSTHYGSAYMTMFRYRGRAFESLLARVGHKVIFQNGAIVYLANILDRNLTIQEQSEIEKFFPKSTVLLSPQHKIDRPHRRYRIKYAGGITWAIDFDTHPTFSLHSKKGGLYLKLLFSNPRPSERPYTIVQLLGMLNPTAEQQMSEIQASKLGLTIQTGYSGTPMTSTQNPDRPNRISAKQYKNMRANLEEKIETAKTNGDNYLANQQLERRAQLDEWYAKQNFTEQGKHKTYFDSMKKLIRDIKSNLRKEKQPGGIAFAQHLDDYLHAERLKFWYWTPPDTNIRWKF